MLKLDCCIINRKDIHWKKKEQNQPIKTMHLFTFWHWPTKDRPPWVGRGSKWLTADRHYIQNKHLTTNESMANKSYKH